MQVRYKCYITRGSRPTVNQCPAITATVTTSHPNPSYTVPVRNEEEEALLWREPTIRKTVLTVHAGVAGRGWPGIARTSLWGRHRPIAAMFLAAGGALGAVDKSAISFEGNTAPPIPSVIISQDILCINVTN